MPDYAKWREGAIKIDFIIETAMLTVMNDGAKELVETLKDEIPVRSGKLRDSIRIIPANKRAGRTVAQVVVGATKETKDYAWATWKGVPEDRTITPGEGVKWLKFKDWARGPSKLRWKDGYFHFRSVNHPARKGDRFVERALAKFRKTLPAKLKRKLKSFFEGKR